MPRYYKTVSFFVHSGKRKHFRIMNTAIKLILLLSLIALMQAKMHRLKIHKDPHGIKKMGNILAMQQRTAKRYHFEIENPPCPEEIDTFNTTYYSYIFVGTPPQQIKVIFDTQIAGVAVTSDQYNPADSKTSLVSDGSYYMTDPLTNDYYEATGIYYDVVTLGTVSLNSQAVEVYDPASIGEYGRLGLGVSDASTFGSVVGNLQNNGLISSELFSMYLVNEASSLSPEYAGELIFGASDPNAYTGTLNYVDTLPKSYEISIGKVSVAGRTIATSFSALIDTGTDLIGTPILPFALINKYFGGVIDSNGNYIVNCSSVDTFPTVDFEIAGATLSIEASAYIVKTTEENGDVKCMSAFTYADINYGYWILGTPILANNYFEFDATNNRIGWAPAAPYSGPLTVNVPNPPTLPLPKKICA